MSDRQGSADVPPQHSLPSDRRDGEGRTIRNRILLALPDSEFQVLRPSLTFLHFPRHASLPPLGEDIVHFLNEGLISLVVGTTEGKTVEVAPVGREGLVGTAALFSLRPGAQRAVVQIAGTGFRVRVDVLRNVLPANSVLYQLAGRYAAIQSVLAGQSAACGRFHGVEQRLARWLLAVQDRVDGSSLVTTHEFLAMMLGTDRPSVSLAAGVLQKRGMIEYSRGAVRIVDRQGLEEATCECYQVMRQFNSPLGFE